MRNAIHREHIVEFGEFALHETLRKQLLLEQLTLLGFEVQFDCVRNLVLFFGKPTKANKANQLNTWPKTISHLLTLFANSERCSADHGTVSVSWKV